jgi:predicted Fe-Mo cluster-binding NifX family protein
MPCRFSCPASGIRLIFASNILRMKKRVAIPVINNMLSEYFGQCSHYEIYESDGRTAVWTKTAMPYEMSVTQLPGWLEEQGITDVIAFRVNPAVIHLFASRKVNLFVGVPVDTPQKLIESYLQGKLESDEKIIKELVQYSTER